MMKKSAENKIEDAFKRTLLPFLGILPVLLGVLALTSLLTAAIPPETIAALLPNDNILGPLLGALTGGIAAGHPMTSYVIAGELKTAGLGLATIAAFLVSWVTVGMVQLPAEIVALGKRFALVRSVLCFLSSIAIGYLTALTMGALG